MKTKGYAENVHAAHANAELFTEMQQDHTLALSNIATAIQVDKKLAMLLTNTVLEISSQVMQLTAKLAKAQAANARMKNRDINQPHPCMNNVRPENQPHGILTQVKIKTYIIEADRGLNLTGTAPTTDTRWRSRTCLQHVAFQ